MALKIIAILFCAAVLFFAGYGIGSSLGYDEGFNNANKLLGKRKGEQR